MVCKVPAYNFTASHRIIYKRAVYTAACAGFGVKIKHCALIPGFQF